MAKQTMTIRIEPSVRDALDTLAAAADRDRSWIVNQALTAYISDSPMARHLPLSTRLSIAPQV